MNSIYKKSFTFRAKRFEEYSNGKCTRQGLIDCVIQVRKMHVSPYNVFAVADYNELEAKVNGADIDGGMSFRLSGNVPSGINLTFNLPLMDEDVLPDRIQYGRLLNAWRGSSDEPIVCNIFSNMQCIRFAMMSPLRIVEFFGEFTELEGV